MIEHQALRHYYEKGGRYLCPRLPPEHNHYVPICKIDDEILFHVDSVVMFCHVSDPTTFSCLTRNKMQDVFPVFRRIRKDGINLTFRILNMRQWEEILKNESV